MHDTLPPTPPAPDQDPVIATETEQVTGETREQIADLEQQVSAGASISEIFTDLTSTIEGLFNQLKEQAMQIPILSSILSFLGVTTAAAATAAASPVAAPAAAPTTLNIVRGQVQIPENLPHFNSSVTSSGWYTVTPYREPVWIEYNSNPYDLRDKHVKVPKATVEYIVGQGYSFESGQTMGEFIETHLLQEVTLPSSFTYADGVSRTIRINRAVAAKYDQVFRALEQRGITYNIVSIGQPFSFRNSRGAGASGLLSNHGLGLAFDMNPAQNGYGHEFTDRIDPSFRAVLAVFREFGFTCGADWNPPDWMHVEFIPPEIAEIINS